MKRVRWFRRLFGYSYFSRIFNLSISTLIILVVISSSVFYLFIDNSVSKNKYESDMDMLMQIEKNFENTNNMITNILKNLYFDPEVKEIMHSERGELDWETIQQKLRKISSDMKIFAPYIESVYIYSNSGKAVYASYIDKTSDVIDMYLYKTIFSYPELPEMTPLLRKIKTDNPDTIEYVDVFSYFLYDTEYDSENDSTYIKSAVVLNINPQWFLDNFYKMNPGKDVQYFLMASNRKFVNADNYDPYRTIVDLTDIYFSKVIGSIKKGNSFGIIPCFLGDVKNLVSYIYLEDEGFIIYKVQTYDSVYAGVKQVKSTVVIISACIVLISLFLALFMARYIYKPFDALVKNVGSHFGYDSEVYGRFDELHFLERSYMHSVDEISLLRSKVNFADNIKYKYYLTQLLINSNTVTESEIADISNSGLFNINVNSTLMMIIIRINSKLPDESTPLELSTWVKDDLNKRLSFYYVNDVIDLENSSVVALINTDAQSGVKKHKEVIYNEVLNMQREMVEKYNISFAAAISDPINSVKELSEVYLKLRQYLSYRYLYGENAIITSELIEKNLKNTSLDYPFSEEKKLVTAIKRQKYDMAKNYMDNIISVFKKMNYNNAIISLAHLCNTITTAINSINEADLSPDYEGIYSINPVEYKTVDDLSQVLMELIKSGCDKDTTAQKHAMLVKAVKNIVYEEYSNPNLSLVCIADRLKISPNYLNYIFKNTCGLSVSDFITDYRLGRAADLLTKTGNCVNAVMSKVGIENASTFYRCFKSKFGTTPKTYIVAALSEKAVESG